MLEKLKEKNLSEVNEKFCSLRFESLFLQMVNVGKREDEKGNNLIRS